MTTSFILHIALASWLFWGEAEKKEDLVVPLAMMDFSDYDPLGGQGGVEESPLEPEPEPPPEPEPESEPESMEEDLAVVESQAKEVEPLPVPPKPLEKPKAKDKPRPKPKSSPATGSGQGSGPPGIGGSGPGGTPGGTGVGNPDALKAYVAKIRQNLERRKKYPPASQSRQEQGVATVTFIVLRDGTVTSPRLATSSGHKRLDDEALALLSRVSPLPRIPEAIGANSLPLKIPLRFSIR
ncbi:MAG: TonB family protein [Deltaproteobacteria bacterium]|nr:TonB family protein [Deltaproteobacteria bacterium]